MSGKKIDLVIGANYGDEGKGITVARIAKSNPNEKIANVLTNGGPQRGHSVSFNNIVHVFHHFGSATPWDAVSFYDRNFIINPMAFKKEYEEIYKKFHIILPNAIRDPMCRWTTPFDMMFNQMESQLNWKGTCGMGIWATICRFKEMWNPTFDYFCEIMSTQQRVEYLCDVRKYFAEKYVWGIPDQYYLAWNSPGTIEHFIDDCMFMYNHTEKLTTKSLDSFDRIIFENGQGLELNDDGKDDPERTPSQTGSNSIFDFSGLIPNYESMNIHYVTRPYVTRHGSKEFKNEQIDGDLKKDEDINQYNEWQRDLLYGKLDLSMLKNRIMWDKCHWKNSPDISYTIDVTHCDEMDRKKEFEIMFKKNFNLNFYGDKEV